MSFPFWRVLGRLRVDQIFDLDSSEHWCDEKETAFNQSSSLQPIRQENANGLDFCRRNHSNSHPIKDVECSRVIKLSSCIHINYPFT